MTPPVVVATLDDRDRSGGEDADPDPAVDLRSLGELLAAVLAEEGARPPAEASLTLVDPDVMAELKAEHFGVREPTDVLSFPIDGVDAVEDTDDAAVPGPARIIGDVVVCPEVAAAQAPGHAGTVEDELALLVVHGALHLCGWDHDVPERTGAMWARERELLGRYHRVPARDPWVDAADAGDGTGGGVGS
jgi:probable rRNA maturation factor